MSGANRALLLDVARPLRPVLHEVLFVGGGVTALLVTDPASPEVRSTVDVTVNVTSYGRYQTFIDRLAPLGFQPAMTGQNHTARFTGHGVILDVMPAHHVAGMSGINPWYAPALKRPQLFELAPSLSIQVIAAPYFLATKLVAFDDRGRDDPHDSKDLADIVSVVEGRPELLAELADSPTDL